MNPSTRLARALVEALLEAGATEAVLAPGSRNAPLAFALYDAAAAGALRLHTRIDERTAGFLALGMAKVSGRPVPVVCTSGTAVANLQPAVLEARHAAVPLVAVTADRPLRLRGTSANQTTDQVGLLRGARGLDLAASEDEGDTDAPDVLLEMLLADRTGPVQVNVQLDDPLLPEDRWQPRPQAPTLEDRVHPRRRGHDRDVDLPRGPRTVVVAGDDAGPAARILAEEGGWPLLAEPTSGARTGDHALRCYRLLLADDLGAEIERVVVVGHPTLSRPVTRLLSRPDVEVWDVGPALWRPRPFAVDHEVSHARVAAAAGAADERARALDAHWLERWRAADASLARQLDTLLAAEPDLTPYEVAGAVSRAVPPDGLLVVGASSPIRDLDLMVDRYRVGERRKVVANRGLAGIDGTLSTAIGAALARPHSERSLLLVGDVTFLHDANALVMGPDEARPDLTVVVVNDDGGSIFSMLEQGAAPYAARYDKLFGTPHGVDLAALCAATRTPHWRVESLPELEHALAQPVGGIDVVEVRCRRDNRRELDARIQALRP